MKICIFKKQIIPYSVNSMKEIKYFSNSFNKKHNTLKKKKWIKVTQKRKSQKLIQMMDIGM